MNIKIILLNNKHDAVYLFLIILLSILLILPFSHQGFFPTHDGEWAVVRLADMYRELKEFQLPPRYSGNLNFGYGYPLFNFAYPFPYYLGFILKAVGFGFVDSIKILFAASVPLSGIGMYYLSKYIWNSRYSGFNSAILYMFLPYRLVDLYVRGSLGESLSFVYFPLIILSFYNIYNLKNIKISVLSLAFFIAFLIMTHNIMAVFFAPIIFFCLLLTFLSRKYKSLFFGLTGSITGVLMAAFFWIPALIEKQFVSLSINPIAEMCIRDRYGKNPYLYKALDFPKDPMLSFMHWTHRTYPYGPLWLAITIPISYIGNQIFIVTFLLFKILVGISYLGSVYFINKIVHKIDSKTSTLATAFFALNPLILIESLVSGHLDIFMVFMALISLFYLVQKRYLLTSMFLIFSIATKFATVFLLPVFLAVIVLQYMKEKITWPQVSIVSLVCLIFSVFAATQKSGNFQPWYLMVLLPFSALLVRNTYIFSASLIFSFSALMSYIPYLYLGHWDEPVPQLLSTLYLITAIVIIIVWSIIYFGKTRFKNNVD